MIGCKASPSAFNCFRAVAELDAVDLGYIVVPVPFLPGRCIVVMFVNAGACGENREEAGDKKINKF